MKKVFEANRFEMIRLCIMLAFSGIIVLAVFSVLALNTEVRISGYYWGLGVGGVLCGFWGIFSRFFYGVDETKISKIIRTLGIKVAEINIEIDNIETVRLIDATDIEIFDCTGEKFVFEKFSPFDAQEYISLVENLIDVKNEGDFVK